MASTVSGTSNFSLDVDDILEAALDPLGGQHTSGIEASKARRTLNLILIELQNKNIPLSKLQITALALISGTASYLIDASISDILECTIKQGTTEIPITRYGMKEYNNIPVKTTANRPNLFATQRLDDQVKVYFWPVPNASTFTVNMLTAVRVDDINAAYQKVDLPYRYLPVLIKWLTYELSKSKMGVPEGDRQRFEKDYKEALMDAFEEDRERSDFIIRPGGIGSR